MNNAAFVVTQTEIFHAITIKLYQGIIRIGGTVVKRL